MKKIFLFAFFLLNFFMIKPQSVQACSCIMPAPPLESMEQSAAVFSGKVMGLSPNEMNIDVPLEVTKVWKGELGKETKISTAGNSAACGYNFEEGKEYLIYAYEMEEGGLGTGLCSRTALLADAQEDVTALGEGQTPAVPESEDENSESTSSSVSYWAMGIGAILILIIILLVRKREK